MTKWIRWWGLGVFLVMVIMVGCVWMLLIDGWVKNLIEEVGTDAMGAKVEVDSADFRLFPVGLTLTRLQVTDPRRPMINAVDIGKVAMALDGLNLLGRKIIIEEMRLEDVRLGVPRTTSGAVRAVPPQDLEFPGWSLELPSLEAPDVKQILEKEELETIRLIETLTADLRREKAIWESRLKQLPGKAQVARYKEQIKKLKQAGKGGLEGFLGGVGSLQSLKEDLERDVNALQGAKKEFEDHVALFRTRFEQIRAAPQRDIHRLTTKYNLSPQGLANITQTLLGDQIGSWVRRGAVWYERAKPFLEGAHALGGRQAGPEVSHPLRGRGVDVHFKEAHPLPEFLIRHAQLSVHLDRGDLAGTIHNITTDQPTVGAPTTFNFSGDRLKGVKSLALAGALNHVVPADSKDSMTGQVQEYALTDLVLSRDDRWPVVLTRGLADFDMNVDLVGRALTARGRAQLSSLHLSAGHADDPNPFTKSLSRAVTGMSHMSLEALVGGTLEDFTVQVSSDLDRVLQQAAGKMMQEAAAKFGVELQSAISAKTAESIQQLKKMLAGFEGMGKELAARVAQQQDLLKSLLKPGLPAPDFKNLPGGLTLP